MKKSEILNKPLPVLVGYLTSIPADCQCPCYCKKEVWLAEGCYDEQAAEYATNRKEMCVEEGDYDDCIQRQVYERVIEAVSREGKTK